jgi:hypothetical protein
MFVVKPNHEVCFDLEQGDAKFKIYFRKVYSENINASEITAFNSGTEDDQNQSTFLYMLRKGITRWEGIVGEDGLDLPFNAVNQQAVFEAIKNMPGVMEKMSVVFMGTEGKNS